MNYNVIVSWKCIVIELLLCFRWYWWSGMNHTRNWHLVTVQVSSLSGLSTKAGGASNWSMTEILLSHTFLGHMMVAWHSSVTRYEQQCYAVSWTTHYKCTERHYIYIYNTFFQLISYFQNQRTQLTFWRYLGCGGGWVCAESIKLLNIYHAQYSIIILFLILKKYV